MLRTHSPVRALTTGDHDEALELCARDPAANVFVAARIEEGALRTTPGALLGYRVGGRLQSLCWASANVVPVECDREALEAFTARIRRWHKGCASVFGPSEQVNLMWDLLQPHWGRPRAIRSHQPLMVTGALSSEVGVASDARVRFARLDADHDLAARRRDRGPLGDLVHAEDRDLGEVDDRRREHAAERARAGDRERRAGQLVARRAARCASASARRSISCARSTSERASASRTTGTIRPASVAVGEADVVAAPLHDLAAPPRRAWR